MLERKRRLRDTGVPALSASDIAFSSVVRFSLRLYQIIFPLVFVVINAKEYKKAQLRIFFSFQYLYYIAKRRHKPTINCVKYKLALNSRIIAKKYKRGKWPKEGKKKRSASLWGLLDKGTSTKQALAIQNEEDTHSRAS